MAYTEDGGDAHGEGPARHMLLAKEIAGCIKARYTVQIDHVSATISACPVRKCLLHSDHALFSIAACIMSVL
jgi:hypothetical protein